MRYVDHGVGTMKEYASKAGRPYTMSPRCRFASLALADDAVRKWKIHMKSLERKAVEEEEVEDEAEDDADEEEAEQEEPANSAPPFRSAPHLPLQLTIKTTMLILLYLVPNLKNATQTP